MREEHFARLARVDAHEALVGVDDLGRSVGLEVEDRAAGGARRVVLGAALPEDAAGAGFGGGGAVVAGRRAALAGAGQAVRCPRAEAVLQTVGIEDRVEGARGHADLREAVAVKVGDGGGAAASLGIGLLQTHAAIERAVETEDLHHALSARVGDGDFGHAVEVEVGQRHRALATGVAVGRVLFPAVGAFGNGRLARDKLPDVGGVGELDFAVAVEVGHHRGLIRAAEGPFRGLGEAKQAAATVDHVPLRHDLRVAVVVEVVGRHAGPARARQGEDAAVCCLGRPEVREALLRRSEGAHLARLRVLAAPREKGDVHHAVEVEVGERHRGG